MGTPKTSTISDSPDALVAVAYSSHSQGNSRLEKMAVQELLDRFGIRLQFTAKPRETKAVAS